MLDNLTEKFFPGRKRKKKYIPIKDYHIPRRDEYGQWWYGYEKLRMIRYKSCTFPLYNGKMDTSNTENSYE